ncbi:hypothetical protein F5B20DRAFT_575727 [Whalleya microplaca]|nr:hypothetical protein F5B20DRAFT_575727 [Whalleya microplaca]
MFARTISRYGPQPARTSLHVAVPRSTRTSSARFASSNEPRQSPSPPADGGKAATVDKSALVIGGAGLAIGAVFMYMLGRLEKEAETTRSRFNEDVYGQRQGPGILLDKGSGGGEDGGKGVGGLDTVTEQEQYDYDGHGRSEDLEKIGMTSGEYHGIIKCTLRPSHPNITQHVQGLGLPAYHP